MTTWNPDGTDSKESTAEPLSLIRRDVLAGAGLIGLAGLGSGLVAAEDGDEEARFARREHDHSGEFDSTPRLGEHAPVESITVEDLQTANTPVVDVRAYGVVGDGETDDSAAFQDAIDAATPHGVLHVPYDVQLRLEQPVEMDFGGTPEQHRFAFICHGMITPAPGIGDAITIRDAAQIYAFIRVHGGGKDVETDTALHLVGGRNQFIEGWGTSYDGTVITVSESGTYSIGFLRTRLCGQSLAVYDASPMGQFHDGFDTAPVRAPEFHDTSDIQIDQYENFVGGNCEQGLLFEDCLSVFADKIAVGGTAEVPIMEVRNTWNSCFNAIHLGGAPDTGALIENTRDTNFQIYSHLNTVGIDYTGGDSARNRFLLNALGVSDTALRIREDITGGYHYVSGNIVAGADVGIDVRTSDADVRLDGLEVVGNDLDLRLPEANDVHLHNSVVGSMNGVPRTINHVGLARGAQDHPDVDRWDVGSTVMFTDTRDDSVALFHLTKDDTWFEVNGTTHLDEPVSRRLAQSESNWVPEFTTEEHLAADGTYGQTFTIDRAIDSIETRIANFRNAESAATMTLFRGTPEAGGLEELTSRRRDPWGPDNEWVSWDLQSEESGTFYLEMSEPEETPTWWAYMVPDGDEDGLADVGGKAFIHREPAEEALEDVDAANFTIRVYG